VFSHTVGESKAGGFELAFAAFLDRPDNGVKSFAKNYLAVGFKLDYVKANGELSNYVPDFFVRAADGTVWLIETKGREEIDLPQKMSRLRQYCEDATSAAAAEGSSQVYRFLYVDQAGFERHKPTTLAELAASFTEYRS
jgi:type III restriction enzyme